jgi:hypothetical protein
MKAASRLSEERFLAFIARDWPGDDAETSLDANASWIGKKIGLSDDQTRAVVQSLADKGFLLARDVEGVILVHPMKAGIDYARLTPMGHLVRTLRSLFVPPSRGG